MEFLASLILVVPMYFVMYFIIKNAVKNALRELKKEDIQEHSKPMVSSDYTIPEKPKRKDDIMENLWNLKDSGILSEDEFNEKVNKLQKDSPSKISDNSWGNRPS